MFRSWKMLGKVASLARLVGSAGVSLVDVSLAPSGKVLFTHVVVGVRLSSNTAWLAASSRLQDSVRICDSRERYDTLVVRRAVRRVFHPV
jgi:hypothetical protein